MKEIPLTKGMSTMVDDSDYDELMKFKWCFSSCSRRASGYAARFLTIEGKRIIIRMHRQIMGLAIGSKLEVDHKDGNRLNNQKSNLRVCTHSENSKNNALSRRNKSGFTGVGFDSRYRRYVARIVVNRRKIHIGYFHAIEDAKRARLLAEIEYFGEYRRNRAENIS